MRLRFQLISSRFRVPYKYFADTEILLPVGINRFLENQEQYCRSICTSIAMCLWFDNPAEQT